MLQPGDWDYVLVSRLGDFPDQAPGESCKPEVLEFKRRDLRIGASCLRLPPILRLCFPVAVNRVVRIQEQGQGTRDQGTAILMTLSLLLARWRAKLVSRTARVNLPRELMLTTV